MRINKDPLHIMDNTMTFEVRTVTIPLSFGYCCLERDSLTRSGELVSEMTNVKCEAKIPSLFHYFFSANHRLVKFLLLLCSLLEVKRSYVTPRRQIPPPKHVKQDSTIHSLTFQFFVPCRGTPQELTRW